VKTVTSDLAGAAQSAAADIEGVIFPVYFVFFDWAVLAASAEAE
jgi:hypothetical protein